MTLLSPVGLRVLGAAAARKMKRLFGGAEDPYPPRPEGTRLSPSHGIDAEIAAAPRRLAFPAGADRAQAEAWAARAHARLAERTGYDPAETPPRVVAMRPGAPCDPAGRISRTTYFLRVRTDADVPVTLLAAAGLETPSKVFLHLSGSTSGVHLGWGEAKLPIDHQRVAIGADMARQAAARGYLAVCIEQMGYGERLERDLPSRSADRTIDAANRALLVGRTLMGLKAMDVGAVIDWLTGPEAPHPVDPARIYLFGHSAGGTAALYAAALDRRIAGCLASGSIGRAAETIGARGSPGGDGIVPGLLQDFETDDLIALIAPRPFVALSGTADHIFPAAGAARAVEGARPAYAAHGAGDRLSAVAVDGPHRYHAEASWRAWRETVDPAT